AQTLVGSIQAGVPLSRVNTNAGADDDDDDDHDDDSRLAKLAKFVRVLTLKPVHLEEDCPITTSGQFKLPVQTSNFSCTELNTYLGRPN
ncbi:unnamed protein product, partial [Porites evermanni]